MSIVRDLEAQRQTIRRLRAILSIWLDLHTKSAKCNGCDIVLRCDRHRDQSRSVAEATRKELES